MRTQQEIAGLGHSNTAKDYKFVLSTKDDRPLELTHIPDGWTTSELTIQRDPEYKGVLTTISTSELTFQKEGRDFIQNAYERSGIDYEITVTITVQNNSTFKYESYYTGKMDLSTYKIDDIGVTVTVERTGFQSSVLNRDNVAVDLLNDKFIGGGDGSMPQITGMPTTCKIPSYTPETNASWKLSGSRSPTGVTYAHFVPMIVNGNEFSGGSAQTQDFESTTPCFTSDDTRTVQFAGTVSGTLNSLTGLQGMKIDVYVKVNGSIEATYNGIFEDVEVLTYSFDIDETLNLVASDEVSLTAFVTANNYVITYDNTSMELIQSFGGETVPEITIDCFTEFEFFARIVQIISGYSNPFESELTGRTDSNPTSYASDGDGSLTTKTKGKFIRDFPIYEGGTTVQTFNASLRDAFKDLNGRLNVGLGFETRSGVEKVVIEKEAYFYGITDNPDYPATDSRPYLVNQVLDLSEDINTDLISKEVIPDGYANEIDSGYQNFEYETIQGLKEFNTKSSYATPIKSVSKKLDLISPFRFDTQGVNKLREKPYSTDSTEDVSGDNNVFGFDVKRDSGFVVKTDEDFIQVSGNVNPEQNYNYDYTPRRNLERHGNAIRSMRLALGDEIQWLESDKNTKLVTQKTGESTPKAENADIVVNDLTEGYWINEAYSTEFPLSQSQLATMLANPRGAFKLGTNKYGWILEIQTQTEGGKAEGRFLRVDLDNVKVVV